MNPPSTTTPQAVTRREAAELCQCTYDHIRRQQERGAYPNAVARDSDNAWVIPITDLVAAGDLDPTAPARPRPTPSGAPTDDHRMAVVALEAENRLLVSEVEFLRRQMTMLVGSLGGAR